MGKDLVQIDRGALQDLMKAIEMLTDLIRNKGKERSLEEIKQDNEKLKYVNKLVLTSMASFENNNP